MTQPSIKRVKGHQLVSGWKATSCLILRQHSNHWATSTTHGRDVIACEPTTTTRYPELCPYVRPQSICNNNKARGSYNISAADASGESNPEPPSKALPTLIHLVLTDTVAISMRCLFVSGAKIPLSLFFRPAKSD